jgi:dihydroneopterin aldolase
MSSTGELDTITLAGMSFHTRIGVLPHEREIAQPLEVDLTAWIENGAGVVDYRKLYDAVQGATSVPEMLYLEDVAESIATGVLRHAGVFRVRIAVRKPHVALGGPLRFAEVAIVRQRHA